MSPSHRKLRAFSSDMISTGRGRVVSSEIGGAWPLRPVALYFFPQRPGNLLWEA